ncbi:MAG: hypothetical protein ABIT05_10565 [Chitinophagaceae bacterium]
MEFYLLDVVDAGVSGSTNWPLIIVVLLTVLVEAVIMLLMKYHTFQRSLLDSLVVNAASLGVGYLLLSMVPRLFASYSITGLLELLLITIVVEGALLYLLNRKHPFVQTIKVCIMMNLATYILFYFFIQFFGQ